MTDPLIDAANAISDASPRIKAFAALAASRIIQVEARLSALETPPQLAPVVKFGCFDDGTIGGEIRDTTWNWFAPHVSLVKGVAPGGHNAVLLVADDSMTFPNQGPLARIHGIGVKGGDPDYLANGGEAWRAISALVPTGYSNTISAVFDEVHGVNGTPPAQNVTFQRGGPWRFYVRGGDAADVANHAMAQWIFGPDDGTGTVGGKDFRQHQDWAGGNQNVTLASWVNYIYGFGFTTFNTDGTVKTPGWFEAQAIWPGLSQRRVIVPRKLSIPTSYPGKLTPYMSLYYNTGGGGQNAIMLGNGAWWSDRDELIAWQDARIGR